MGCIPRGIPERELPLDLSYVRKKERKEKIFNASTLALMVYVVKRPNRRRQVSRAKPRTGKTTRRNSLIQVSSFMYPCILDHGQSPTLQTI